ncbi:unnamed protein product [Parnassius apollo]|uniref:(apollo) hypothetical protein n=1 Tax=Parnassius apollo TaxID=110799 RepID=A0A8S3WDA8_PARAO|nr:unnamed protein product [Parnassius apollo]
MTAELSNHNMKNNSKQLINIFDQFINPFSAEIPQELLFNITSGKAASEKVEKIRLSIEKAGDIRRQTFITECEEDENRFEKSIKSATRKLFCRLC